jgi:tetratricopeptide (TPR) repeat protein
LALLGWAELQVGRLEPARANLEEARELHIALGNRPGTADCNLGLGILERIEGRSKGARARFVDALETFEAMGIPYWIAFAQLLLAQLESHEGDDESAERRYRASLTTAWENGLVMLTTSVLQGFADLALLRGQHERALRLAGASDALREPFGEKSPLEQTTAGDVRGAASAVFDEATAEALYREGRRVELADAVAYALETETVATD